MSIFRSVAAKLRVLIGLGVFVAVFLISPLAMAHGGEDHGDETKAAAPGIAARVTASSDQFEIVGVPVTEGGGTIRFYLTEFWTNAPVKDAKIEVTKGEETSPALPKNNHYELKAPWVTTAGSYPLTISITSGKDSDLLIGTLDIPAAATAEEHNSIWDHLLPHDFSMPKSLLPGSGIAAALFLLAGFLTRGVARRLLLTGFAAASVSGLGMMALESVTRDANHHGTGRAVLDLPDTARRAENGSIFLPKATQALLGVETFKTALAAPTQKTETLSGQVITDPNRSGLVQSLLSGRISPPDGGFPAIGSRVEKGAILGYLTPRVELVDQSDIRQTTGDLDRQIKLAEAKVARYDKLKGVLAEALIQDAHLELDGLRERRSAINPVLGEKEALTAPVSGIVSQANVSAGQVIDAQATLFQIVDTDSLYVEALAFDVKQAAEIERDAIGATATASNGSVIELEFAGRGLSLKQQAVLLRYRVKSGGADLGIGQPVAVSVPVQEPVKAIAVPRASVVRFPNGQMSVLVHVAPERFEARPVASFAVDADRVGITAGLDPDVRIVGRGAELVSQVR